VIYKFFYINYLIDSWKSKNMGMGMSIRIYSLSGRIEDMSKVVYPLGLEMTTRMKFYDHNWDGIRDGKYTRPVGIAQTRPCFDGESPY